VGEKCQQKQKHCACLGSLGSITITKIVYFIIILLKDPAGKVDEILINDIFKLKLLW
jgi:hypothetical protein